MARKKKKSLRKRILSTRAAHYVIARSVHLLIYLTYHTARITMYIPPSAQAYMNGEKTAVFCFWHGRMIMIPCFRPPRPIRVLISQHNDGALINRILEQFGIRSVRGSSHRVPRRTQATAGSVRARGGVDAVRQLVHLAEQGCNIGITPDGPRGPFQKAAQGAAFVAMKTGTPLIPVTFSANRHWRFRSWDKFMLPKLFTPLVFMVGDPITVAADADEAARDLITAQLEAQLISLTEQADRTCGVTPA